MKCEKPAMIHYKWGTEDHYSCLEHANQIATLCQYMGWPFCPHPYIKDDKVCQQEIEKDETKILKEG